MVFSSCLFELHKVYDLHMVHYVFGKIVECLKLLQYICCRSSNFLLPEILIASLISSSCTFQQYIDFVYLRLSNQIRMDAASEYRL